MRILTALINHQTDCNFFTGVPNLEICVEALANMKRYIAFLRGINISGKNKVPMAELKKEFEEVKTYFNSGNVTFSSDQGDTEKFTKQIEIMIKNSLL